MWEFTYICVCVSVRVCDLKISVLSHYKMEAKMYPTLFAPDCMQLPKHQRNCYS